MHVDFPSKRISISLEYYETAESPERTEASLEFEDVESFSQIADFVRMERNAFAGNVNYWVPEATAGTTYIYLADGCIVVKAGRLRVSKPA